MNDDVTTPQTHDDRLVTASRDIAAPAETIFELIADPSQQPRWDGNDNLAEAAPGQRVRADGDVFVMTLTNGGVRDNHVVAFVEGREIVWAPAPEGEEPSGHRWGWILEPVDDDRTRVTHLYDFTALPAEQEKRLAKARLMTPEKLMASIDRLAQLAEEGGDS
ncbi:SRPBCC family protein [uncultured Brachybacterium sp.]|uniref:SRPBCC family protein n=1 Tax=uncultured Brachybacterium sp. TaxID=189680 RepID=UPI0026258623|nr:SRPBCC family protein [uncultured Brachybacterium sp.]